VIGHALTVSPTPATRAVWDRWIAIGFAVGSACFFIGSLPGFVQLVGAGADGAVFFAGSVFFTLAAGLELREATLRLGRWASDPSWWSAAIQFVGTLLFNVNTFDAMQSGLHRKRSWTMAAVNLAGCVLFMASAIASYVVPATGSVLDLAAANWCTGLGALCFFAGALLLLPSRRAAAPDKHPPSTLPIKEV
jgi:hypothetical protein